MQWATAQYWIKSHAHTAAVICQRLYRWVSYLDTGRPRKYTTYYSRFPFDTMLRALQDMRGHLPIEEAQRNEFLEEAIRQAGPHALGLALGFLAADRNEQRFYHVLQRDNFYDQHWQAWVANVWIRPAWPAPPLVKIAPPDVRISFNDNWGAF